MKLTLLGKKIVLGLSFSNISVNIKVASIRDINYKKTVRLSSLKKKHRNKLQYSIMVFFDFVHLCFLYYFCIFNRRT